MLASRVKGLGSDVGAGLGAKVRVGGEGPVEKS